MSAGSICTCIGVAGIQVVNDSCPGHGLGLPTYPCCDHCVPDTSGKCWATKVGHGAHCLDCQKPTDPEEN